MIQDGPPAVAAPLGLCTACGRAVRGGALCPACGALLHRNRDCLCPCTESSQRQRQVTDRAGAGCECDELSRLVAFLGRQLHEARCRVEELEHPSRAPRRPPVRRHSSPTGGGAGEISGALLIPVLAPRILVTDYDSTPAAPSPRKSSVEVIADGLGAGISVLLRDAVGGRVQVTATVRRGAGLPQLLPDLRRCLLALAPDDSVVVIAECCELYQHSVVLVEQFIAELMTDSAGGYPRPTVVLCIGRQVWRWRPPTSACFLPVNSLGLQDFVRYGKRLNRRGKKRLADLIVSCLSTTL